MELNMAGDIKMKKPHANSVVAKWKELVGGGPAGSSHNGRLSNARYYYGYAAKNVPLFRKIAFDTSNK